MLGLGWETWRVEFSSAAAHNTTRWLCFESEEELACVLLLRLVCCCVSLDPKHPSKYCTGGSPSRISGQACTRRYYYVNYYVLVYYTVPNVSKLVLAIWLIPSFGAQISPWWTSV